MISNTLLKKNETWSATGPESSLFGAHKHQAPIFLVGHEIKVQPGVAVVEALDSGEIQHLVHSDPVAKATKVASHFPADEVLFPWCLPEWPRLKLSLDHRGRWYKWANDGVNSFDDWPIHEFLITFGFSVLQFLFMGQIFGNTERIALFLRRLDNRTITMNWVQFCLTRNVIFVNDHVSSVMPDNRLD